MSFALHGMDHRAGLQPPRQRREIGLANLQARLTGAAPADPSTIWPRWDSLTPDVMVSGLAAADSKYLDALDGPNL